MTDLPEATGEKLSKLTIDIADAEIDNELINYRVESDGEKQTEFDLPRYDTHLGWIEIFGLPPYNEWVLLKEFEQLNKNFCGKINGENYSENLKIEDRGPAGVQIQLERKSGGAEETYRITELDATESSASESAALFHVDHSDGTYDARIDRRIAQESGELEDLKQELNEKERDYIENIISMEEEPDIAVLKKAQVNGETPAVYRKMFPFWERTEFENSEIRVIELGYMEYGDTDSEVDKLHGRWYKLFSFQDFDYDQLEIREGNWRSTEVELEGQKQNTKQHYEKHLYRY